MGDFKREQRYIVLKLKDIMELPINEQGALKDALDRLKQFLPARQFVCVESDWPEYETVWGLIKSRVEGIPNEIDTIRDRVAELESALAKSASRAAALVEKLKVAEEALAEVREVWAGAECGEPVHAQEAYAIRLCKQMYGYAVAALAKIKEAS